MTGSSVSFFRYKFLDDCSNVNFFCDVYDIDVILFTFIKQLTPVGVVCSLYYQFLFIFKTHAQECVCSSDCEAEYLISST